jgi:hypothetical protein
VDIVADKEFTVAKYSGRNVIIYGNATTNSAWPMLLKDCPLQITRAGVKAGNNHWGGDDLAAYFVWPQAGGTTSVGVVAATGVNGMNAAFANQYFAGGSGFPDFMVFRLGMLTAAPDSVKMVGFFNNQWKLDPAEMIVTP